MSTTRPLGNNLVLTAVIVLLFLSSFDSTFVLLTSSFSQLLASLYFLYCATSGKSYGPNKKGVSSVLLLQQIGKFVAAIVVVFVVVAVLVDYTDEVN